MRLVVDREVLRAALALTKSCLPPKPMNDNEANPLITVTPGQAVVTCTDMSHSASACIDVVATENFQVTFDIKKMERVLTKSDKGSVELVYDPKAGLVRVRMEDGEGHVDIPSLPANKVPVFDMGSTGHSEPHTVKADALAAAIEFTSAFLPDVVERNPVYDFILLKDGMAYAANGMNRRGYFVSKVLRIPEEFKVLKKFSNVLPKMLKHMGAGDVTMSNGDRTVKFVSPDGKISYSCLRARSEAPVIKMEYLKSNGPYTTMDLPKVLKNLEKIVIPDYQSAGAAVGVNLVLGVGDDKGSAPLELSLISAGKYSAKEKVQCKRIDEVEGGVVVDKVIDYKMFKEIAGAVPSKGDLRVYLNDPDAKMFKLLVRGSIEGSDYVAVSVGAYARLNRAY